MYQRPQSNQSKQLGQVDTKSAYFTHIEPPPSPSQMHYQYNNHGYAGTYGEKSSPGFVKPVGSYGSPLPASPPHSHVYAEHTGELRKPSSHRPGRRNANGGGCLSCFGATFFLLVWTAALAGGGYYWYTEINFPEVQTELQHWKNRLEDMEQVNSDLARKLQHHPEHDSQQLQQQVEELQRSLHFAQSERENAHNMFENLKHEAHEVQIRLDEERRHAQEQVHQLQLHLEEERHHAQEQVHQLQHAIQVHSRQLVLQKYGHGPYRVEFEVEFPHGEHSWFFGVELAPLEHMPHAVATFLEQVHLGLYNHGGFAFHHNGHHITYGSPVPNMLTHPDGVDDMEAAQAHLTHRFTDSGFGSLLFTEYSPEFPHTEYTLAFAGRPGGPSLYINTVNNADAHGEMGDPCFAKVITGMDVVEQIHQASGGHLQLGDWKETSHGPIAVRTAKIIAHGK